MPVSTFASIMPTQYLIATAAGAIAPIVVVASTWTYWMGHRRKRAEQYLVERSEHIGPLLRDLDVSCGTCGYNLRGHTKAECPECGVPIKLAFTVHPGFGQALLLWLTFCTSLSKALSLAVWTSFQFFNTMNLGTPAASYRFGQLADFILFAPLYLYCATSCARIRSLEPPLNITHPSCLLLAFLVGDTAFWSAWRLITDLIM